MSSQLPPIRVTYEVIDADGPHNPHIKAAGDIDGDGADEVVVASSDGGPLVWYDPPQWERHVIAPSGRWSCDARLVDMSGSGAPDLLISEWYTRDRLEWYENPAPEGDPATRPWLPHVVGHPKAHDICVADLDGDGRSEICTRTQGADGDHLVIWTHDGDAWRSRVMRCPAGEGLAAGDLDGDGRAEVIIADRWYGVPADLRAGVFTEHVFAQWPPDAVVRVHDINGDGRPDIVLTRSEGPHRLSWFEPPDDPASGLWTEHIVEPALDFAHSLAIADLNGDGLADIVTAEMHQSEGKRVMVYLNAGEARRWERHILARTGSHNVCIARLAPARVAAVGANWSGPHQPVEAWIIEAGEP
ncbi:MAG: FG-GAP repeat domain-containing protein [Armatimonadota bacterium]